MSLIASLFRPRREPRHREATRAWTLGGSAPRMVSAAPAPRPAAASELIEDRGPAVRRERARQQHVAELRKQQRPPDEWGVALGDFHGR